MRVLAIQLKRIGDLILTTPSLNLLRDRHPGAMVDLILSENVSQLAPAITSVNPLVYSSLSQNIRLWRYLRREKFAACYDFTGTDRSALVTLLSGAPCRRTFRRVVERSSWRRLVYNELVESSVRENHTVDHYLDLVELERDRKRTLLPELKIPSNSTGKAEQILKGLGIANGNFFIVHPGSARIEKMWPPERWSQVIEHCTKTYLLPCLLTGGRAELEKAHVEKIISKVGDSPCYNLCGQTDLLTLGALIEQSRFLLGVDSAAVHLAGAFGIAHVVLYGPTNPFHWCSRNENATVLLAGHTKPLRKFETRHQKLPVANITTQQVILALKSRINTDPTLI